MTSITPFTNPYIIDKVEKYETHICNESLLGIIKKDYPKFYRIVQLAGVDGVLNDKQTDLTIFVSENGLDHICKKQQAVTLIRNSIVKKKITSYLLTDSPISMLTTLGRYRLSILNLNSNIYVNDSKLTKKDIVASNGIIQELYSAVNIK